MRVGSELAPFPEYLLGRADEELNVRPRLGTLARRFAPLYVRLFGVPEIGVQLRIDKAIRLVPRNATNIVDVGCGAGMLLGMLHRRRPAAQLTGIELDAPSADLARKTHSYANVVTGDAIAVAREMRSRFDCAVSIDVLEHIADTDLPAFTEAMATMLRPGGTLVAHVPGVNQFRHFQSFANWGHHDHEREGFTDETLRALLVAANFEVERIQPTFGFAASLAWELNMKAAAHPIQAIAFPPLLALAAAGESIPSSRYNGLIVVARKR